VKPFHLIPALLAALFLSACGGTHLPSGVRTIGIGPSPRHAPQVLAPANSGIFARMAEGESLWAVGQLRAALARELAAGGRFQSVAPGKGDAEFTIDTLRHGLIEVTGGSYAVTVTATISIQRGTKELGPRELEGQGSTLRPLKEFEDPATYQAALQSAFDKLAMEFVAEL
jgi:hypothetical protein